MVCFATTSCPQGSISQDAHDRAISSILCTKRLKMASAGSLIPSTTMSGKKAVLAATSYAARHPPLHPPSHVTDSDRCLTQLPTQRRGLIVHFALTSKDFGVEHLCVHCSAWGTTGLQRPRGQSGPSELFEPACHVGQTNYLQLGAKTCLALCSAMWLLPREALLPLFRYLLPRRDPLKHTNRRYDSVGHGVGESEDVAWYGSVARDEAWPPGSSEFSELEHEHICFSPPSVAFLTVLVKRCMRACELHSPPKAMGGRGKGFEENTLLHNHSRRTPNTKIELIGSGLRMRAGLLDMA